MVGMSTLDHSAYIAFDALAHLTVAKQQIVVTDGIGEDLRATVLGYTGRQLRLAARIKKELPIEQQVPLFGQVVQLMRLGWGIDGAVYGHEVYIEVGESSFDPGLSRAARFGLGDPTVLETVTALAVTSTGEITCVSQPYIYQVGRIVDYDTPMVLEGMTTDEVYPNMLAQMLQLAHGEITPVSRAAGLRTIAALGFTASEID